MNEVNQRLRSAVELAGIRRPELASLLGVSVTTVNGWFSSGRTIPKLKQNAIEAIVKQARRPELKFDDIVSFSVRLTPLERKQLCDIAGGGGPFSARGRDQSARAVAEGLGQTQRPQLKPPISAPHRQKNPFLLSFRHCVTETVPG